MTGTTCRSDSTYTRRPIDLVFLYNEKSCRACVDMFTLFVAGRVGEDIVFNEEEWASEEKSVPYEKSKRRAELAAWELVKGLPGTMFTSAGLKSR